jgi:hypothetical protein
VPVLRADRRHHQPEDMKKGTDYKEPPWSMIVVYPTHPDTAGKHAK